MNRFQYALFLSITVMHGVYAGESVPDKMPVQQAVPCSPCDQTTPSCKESKPTVLPLIIYQPDDAIRTDFSPYREKIQALLSYLASHPFVSLQLEGSADERKNAEYSFAIGQRYADSVQKHLVRQGVDPARIYPVSLGKEKPVAVGHTRKSWAKNRRVEIKFRQGEC